MNWTKPAKRLSTRTKLLFSTGDLTTTLTLAIQTFYQLYFLTDVARLPPATVGWLIGITRLWDAVNDPIVGFISDRLSSKLGRRRALLVYGSFPLGVAFSLCWIVPEFSQFWLAVYFTLIVIAFDTAFTVVHVGFNALTPQMTSDYDERTNLNGYRMMFSLCGTAAAIVFATIVGRFVADETSRFAIVGISLGGLAMIPPWVVFMVTRGVEQDTKPSQMPILLAIRSTLSNRAFTVLSIIYLTSWTATCVMAAMLIYFATYVMKIPDQSNYLILTAHGSAILFIPVSVWLASQLDKPKAFVIGIGFWCIVLTGFFLMPVSVVWLAYLVAFLCGPGIATANVIPWSMLPDVIEVEQQDTGERREGAYYALVSFMQKLGTGIALWSVGLALSRSGYLTPTVEQPIPVQPESALAMIRFIIGPATIGLLLVSLPFAWWYPVNRQKHVQTLQDLNRNPQRP